MVSHLITCKDFVKNINTTNVCSQPFNIDVDNNPTLWTIPGFCTQSGPLGNPNRDKYCDLLGKNSEGLTEWQRNGNGIVHGVSRRIHQDQRDINRNEFRRRVEAGVHPRDAKLFSMKGNTNRRSPSTRYYNSPSNKEDRDFIEELSRETTFRFY